MKTWLVINVLVRGDLGFIPTCSSKFQKIKNKKTFCRVRILKHWQFLTLIFFWENDAMLPGKYHKVIWCILELTTSASKLINSYLRSENWKMLWNSSLTFGPYSHHFICHFSPLVELSCSQFSRASMNLISRYVSYSYSQHLTHIFTLWIVSEVAKCDFSP